MMMRALLIFVMMAFFLGRNEGQARGVVVADSLSRQPLASASVFDKNGKIIGICHVDGALPYISNADYPITVRYMGFKERIVAEAGNDTIFLSENITELPEVVVEHRQQKVLHMLAYVREYSTLSTYTDTVFLFREQMVDFMLPTEAKSHFKGWRVPRVIKSKSYYHFTNSLGLDSVSDRCNQHFSWTDWIGVLPTAEVPAALVGKANATDTVFGKYSPTEVWVKSGDRLRLDINVLADTTSRKMGAKLVDIL